MAREIVPIISETTRKTANEEVSSSGISLAGASLFRLEYAQDAGNDFDRGTEIYQIAVDLSDDDGITWRMDTLATCQGSTRSPKDNRPHYIELRAMEQIQHPDGTISMLPTVWDVQTRARIRLRCGRAGRVGVRGELER